MHGLITPAGDGAIIARAAGAWPFEPLNPFAYDLIVADPPWKYAYRGKPSAKTPDAQYQTMSLARLGALPIGDLLAPAGVLVLWTTWPFLATGAPLDLMRRWGVEPKTGGCWAKRTRNGRLRWGTGYLLRSVIEPFVIGSLPAAGFRGSSEINLVDGLAREHSRKPDEFYAMLDRIVAPGKRKLDLFSRDTRPGWDAWGDEAGKFDKGK